MDKFTVLRGIGHYVVSKRLPGKHLENQGRSRADTSSVKESQWAPPATDTPTLVLLTGFNEKTVTFSDAPAAKANQILILRGHPTHPNWETLCKVTDARSLNVSRSWTLRLVSDWRKLKKVDNLIPSRDSVPDALTIKDFIRERGPEDWMIVRCWC